MCNIVTIILIFHLNNKLKHNFLTGGPGGQDGSRHRRSRVGGGGNREAETGGALLQAVVGYLGTIELSLDSTAGGLQVIHR